MRVLVVGGGGREHALAWRLDRSGSVDAVLAAPGNPGIARVAACHDVAADGIAAIAALVEREGVDLTVVGPEGPLVAGLADELRSAGHLVFGPGREGSRLEGSKAWAKGLCERHGIPAGRSVSATRVDAALDALDRFGPPYVVKADGLAAGKGVVIVEDRADAEAAVRAALVDGAFGDAGSTVVIEEHLSGREVSAFALTDGTTTIPLGFAQDHKRVGDGDAGPNTGGMGAYAPVPFVDAATGEVIEREILEATVRALAAEGVPYVGVVYAGLMLTPDGPRVLEYNARFGDPETQVLMPRIRSDLGEVLLACAEGDAARVRLEVSDAACVTVVLASGGYPGPIATGVPIEGLEDAERVEGALVFHAGTSERQGRVATSGGRVLSVSGVGATIGQARDRAYDAASRIRFEGMQHRRDIAASAAREEGE